VRTWTDLSKIHTPDRIKAMRKDERGYPIPHTVQWIDGKPDFRVIDPQKWMHAVNNCMCGVCGQKIEGVMAFVGGESSIANRFFTDLSMHTECAEYALKVCPFIAAPKFSYLLNSEGIQQGEMTVISSVSDKRPSRFGLGLTTGYKLARLMPQDDLVIWADPFITIEWWQKGAKLDVV